MFDSKSVKSTFATIINDFLSPEQLLYDSTIDVTVDVYQQFTPYCQSLSTAMFYVSGTIGTPSSLVVSLCSNTTLTTVTSVTLNPVVGWNTVTFDKEIVSKIPYFIKFSDMGDTNYAQLGASTVITPQYIKAYVDGSLSSLNTAFSVTRGTLTYTVYPEPDRGNYSYPIVVVDVIGRPRVNYRYLDRKIWEEYITVQVDAYSKYPDELDEILRFTESAMAEYSTLTFSDNRSITNIFVITPSGYSGISRWRENILTRNITFNCRTFVKNTIG